MQRVIVNVAFVGMEEVLLLLPLLLPECLSKANSCMRQNDFQPEHDDFNEKRGGLGKIIC